MASDAELEALRPTNEDYTILSALEVPFETSGME